MSRSPKSKTGRPTVDGDRALSEVVKTYVDPPTYARLLARAEARHLKPAAYLRELIINDQEN